MSHQLLQTGIAPMLPVRRGAEAVAFYKKEHRAHGFRR